MIDMKQIAKLSMLRITEQEEDKFQEEIEHILSMIQMLPPLEEKNVLLHPEDPMLLRDDVITPSLSREVLLQSAPEVKAGCVVVPKVID